MLFIVSTPIGNLQDITHRAIDTLKSCDYILCEDTRQSIKLLTHFGIEKRLVSFHQFNEQAKENQIISDLHEGKQIALISDAGTPLISDPGTSLIKRCIQENIPISAAPGACALIYALTCSGFEAAPFQFIGFLLRKQGELTRQLQQALDYPGTTIAYESPERIGKTIQAIRALEENRPLCVGRELTKKFETFYRGKASELAPIFSDTKVKGEIVLLIGKSTHSANVELDDAAIKELVFNYQSEHNVSLTLAIKEIAKAYHLQKRKVYELCH